MESGIEKIFKKQLIPKGAYKGGKGKSEVIAKLGNKKIHKLSSNENILGPSPKAFDAIINHMGKISEYPERTDIKLRKALSKFYGNILSPDQFITSNSGVAMIELIERVFLNEKSNIIISNPAFKPYQVFAQRIGAKVIDIPLIGDAFELDVTNILKSVNKNTRLIFVTSPNNPTGTHIPKSQLDELINNIPDHVIVVIDEVYFQYATAEDYTTALPYVDAGKNVIAINSFSKAYGLAGIRMGYAYSSEKIAKYISSARLPFMLNTLGMEAAIASLEDKPFIKMTVELINSEKKFLYQELDKLDIKYWKSEANFITIKPEMNDKEFEAKILEHGIMVRPVASFGHPGCIRVTIGDRTANKAYLKALKKVLKK